MHFNSKRPVYLSLTQFHFPVTAISSIMHRITGCILFFGLSFLLYALGKALESEQGFMYVRDELLASFLGKLITWGLLSALIYHIVAGIKHFVLEAGYAETLTGSRNASWTVIGSSILFIILAGVWVW